MKDLIKYFCQKFSLSNDVIQKLCDKIDVELPHREVPISGADIENMCREEAMKLIRSKIESSR